MSKDCKNKRKSIYYFNWIIPRGSAARSVIKCSKMLKNILKLAVLLTLAVYLPPFLIPLLRSAIFIGDSYILHLTLSYLIFLLLVYWAVPIIRDFVKQHGVYFTIIGFVIPAIFFNLSSNI